MVIQAWDVIGLYVTIRLLEWSIGINFSFLSNDENLFEYFVVCEELRREIGDILQLFMVKSIVLKLL